METLQLTYNGMPVIFSKGERVFQKITPVLQRFDEKANNYFRGKDRTQRYTAIARRNNLSVSFDSNMSLYNSTDFAHAFPDMVKTEAGRKGGTWLSQEVLIDFAQWLSPDFAAWCDEKIREIMGYEVATREVLSELKVIRKIVDKMIEQEDKLISQDKKIQQLEEHVKKTEEKTRKNYYSVAGYAYLKNIHVNHDKAQEISTKAKKKCRDRNVAIDNYVHDEYGKIYVFPAEVLSEVFKEMF